MLDLSEVVKPSKTAIIGVDVQNGFCEPAGVAGKAGKDTSAAMAMIPTLQHFLDAARAHGTNIIFIQTIHEPATDSDAWVGRRANPDAKNCLKGTWGAEFTGVGPKGESEPVVIKHRYSAFINTRLESVLRTLKAENIIVLGVSTNVCVESTARHGFMLDYHTTFVSDCSAAYDKAAHDMTLKTHAKHFGHVATAKQIIDAWTATHSVAATA
jgi:ureidoacrylate peracid hydrolase